MASRWLPWSARSPPRVQFLRHRVGLRLGPQRAAAPPTADRLARRSHLTSPPRSPRRTAAGRPGRTTGSMTCFPRITSGRWARQPGEPGPRLRRRAATARLDGRLGGRRAVAARRGRSETRGAHQGVRHQRQPLGAGQCRQGVENRQPWTASRWSTTSSTRAPRTSCSSVCQELNVGIIARVPFDEGSLTGSLAADAAYPEGDWRALYSRATTCAKRWSGSARLVPVVPAGMTLPDLALRFILEHPAVTTTIPGMRRARHVDANLAVSDGRRLAPGLLEALRGHRWDRTTVIP